MAAVPGSLMSPPRVSLQMAPPAIHSVLLVSNLNPEVRGHTETKLRKRKANVINHLCLRRASRLSVSSSYLVRIPHTCAVGVREQHVGAVTVWFGVFSGVYGDVQRVKILFNKKENALVQMSDATQAQLGQAAFPHKTSLQPNVFALLLGFN